MLQTINIKSPARTIKLRSRACHDPDRWMWPLPAISDGRPCVLACANDARLAIDVGYAERDATSSLVPVYAVHDGTIQLARKTVSGFALVIDHHGEWSSYYARLHRMTCTPTWDDSRPKVRVRAGQIIGYTKRDASIRFELWRWIDDAGFVPVAPERQMSTWLVLSEREPHSTATLHVIATAATSKAAA